MRFIYNDFNSLYRDLRVKADRPLLYVERLKAIVSEVHVFKLHSNCSPLYNGFLIKKCNMRICGRRLKPLELPAFSKSLYGKKCFKYRAAMLWNNLVNSYKACIDIDDFKKCLQNWAGPTCSCSYCILCILNLM